MKKKQRSKKSRDLEVKRDVKSGPQKAASYEDDFTGKPDYGGLPDRDLKKNLGGCG